MKKYRIIIAGSGDYTDYESVKKTMRYATRDMDVTEIEIISGRCPRGKLTFTTEDGIKVYGADGLGERYAREMAYPVKPMPADWNRYGRSAGTIRNSAMGKIATHCYIFWDGVSRGAKDMEQKSFFFKLIGETITT